MRFLVLLFIIFSSACWSDAQPDRPKKNYVLLSHQLPEEGGKWMSAIRQKDGTIGRFRTPSTPSSARLAWGSEYEITTQQRWNGMKGMFQNYFVSLNKTTDKSGKSYKLEGIEAAHIAIFDSTSGEGRFSNKRNMCSAAEEKAATNPKPQIQRCGLKFTASPEVAAEIKSIANGTGKRTFMMEHQKHPTPDRVISIK